MSLDFADHPLWGMTLWVLPRANFFWGPDVERRAVIAFAEFADGTDIQLQYRADHPVTIVGDDYDETQLAVEFFAMPSLEVH
jgi:hypothetical protein